MYKKQELIIISFDFQATQYIYTNFYRILKIQNITEISNSKFSPSFHLRLQIQFG